MLDPTDSFEIALAVDAAVLAYERRTAGHNVHRPVDAKLLITIADALDLSTLPAEPPYERITALQKLVDALPEPKRDELVKLLVEDRARAPWRSFRGPQTQLFEATQHVDLIGAAGSAGSSKTDGAIGAALLGASSCRFVRGTVGELNEILRRIAAITQSVDGRNLSEQRWELPAPWGYQQQGTALSWAGLSDEGQAYKISGRPVTLLVCDDAASGWLTQDSLNFVRQWLRSTGVEHTCTVLTMNPPTSADSLFIRNQLFAPWLSPDHPSPAQSGEVRWFVRGEEVDAGTPGAESRTVITSLTSANPYYVRSGYADRLMNISDPVLRARLALNDWSAGFEEDDPYQALPSAWIAAAMARWTPQRPADAGLDALGVDCARGGADRSVISKRYGAWFAPFVVIPGKDTPDGQSLAVRILAEHEPGCTVLVDGVGVGGSVVDQLRDHIPNVVSINAGKATPELDASRTFGFANVKALLVWRLRELLSPENPNPIALPNDKTLAKELASYRYAMRSGKIVIETKDETKRKLKRSPDLAEAVLLAAIPTSSNLARERWSWRREAQRRRRLAKNA